MTALRERPLVGVTRVPARRSQLSEMVTGVVGVLAAGVGAWMYYVPTDWFLGGLTEGWFFGLFIAAGLLLTTAFGLYARKAYVDAAEMTMGATVATLLAVAALGGAIAFALILIL